MELTDYHQIVKECRRFAGRKIDPGVLEIDLNPSMKAVRALWDGITALDLPYLLIPEDRSGAGYPPLCAALVLDTLAMSCAGLASVLAYHYTASVVGTTSPFSSTSFAATLELSQRQLPGSSNVDALAVVLALPSLLPVMNPV